MVTAREKCFFLQNGFFWFECIGAFYHSREIITMAYILSRCKDSNKLIQYYIINNKLYNLLEINELLTNLTKLYI